MAANGLKIAGAVGGGLLLVLGGAQLVRPDMTNPPEDPARTITAKLNVPPETAALMFSACGDCHSNRTAWPWYAQITPVNWWIAGHVEEGREELNLSDWDLTGDESRKKLGHIIEELVEDAMPPAYYRPMHPSNQLTQAQRTSLADWFKAELDRQGGPLPEGHKDRVE